MRSLTDRIRDRLEEVWASGVSQAELGRRVGVSRQAINLFIAGKMSLSLETLERLLPVLNAEIVFRDWDGSSR